MSSHKDWHAVGEDDFRTTSEDDQSSDFDIIKGVSEDLEIPEELRASASLAVGVESGLSDAAIGSSQASNSTNVSDMDSNSSDAESEDTNQTSGSVLTSMHEGPLETAFAASSAENAEDDTPIDFDSDDELEDGMGQAAWQKTNAYMRDMQQAFRDRPAVRVQGNHRYMKVLLVGEHGLGKEAFIKNVFAPYCADNDLPVNMCEVDTNAKDFREEPSDYCTEVVIDVDEGRTKIHYHMQDTPGTHQQNSLPIILEHVRNQNRDYMAMEEDSKRNVPLGSLPDPRVDIALYFLSPFFLKPQDITAMSNLARFVPVVPLIAKADALTTVELTKYSNEIKEQLDIAEEKAGYPIMHNFSAEQLQLSGAIREVPPFAIITSSEIDSEVGRHWFTRTFPWGKCEVMSSNHSDLPALKSLLFEHCFESIKAATEARFYTARESYLTTRALSKAMYSKEIPPTQPATRPKSSLAETAAAVKASALPTKKASKSSKPQKSFWGWGWTAGLVTAAVLLQLLALTYYSRNMSSLKTLVDTYQAESAAEKQEIQEMLRERLYAIEHKPSGWRYSHMQPMKGVGEFFTAAGTSIKSASLNTASAIHSSAGSGSQALVSSLSSHSSFLGGKVQNAWTHTHQTTRQGLKAIPQAAQNVAKSVGLSVKRGSNIAYRATVNQLSTCSQYSKSGLKSTWASFSSALNSQGAIMKNSTTRAFSALGQRIQSGSRSTGRGLRRGFNRTGQSLKTGFVSMGSSIKTGSWRCSQAVKSSFQSASRGIASSCQDLAQRTWNRLRISDRAISHCGSSIANASKILGAKVASAGRFTGQKASDLGEHVSYSVCSGVSSVGNAFKVGAKSTQWFVKDLAHHTAQSTHSILTKTPSLKDIDAWYKQNSKSITRLLRRAAVANVLQ